MNVENGLKFLFVWIFIWFIIISSSKFFTPYVLSILSRKWRETYDKSDDFKKLMISWHVNALVHLGIAIPTVFYGVIYADGKPGTSWFADEHYWHTAFDYQKYFIVWTCSYFLAEAAFMFIFIENTPLIQ